VIARGARFAQRLVHVGERVGRTIQRRVAAGDDVEQHAALGLLENLQTFAAQRQDPFQRFAVLALHPQAARDADRRQDLAGAILRRVETALCVRQFMCAFARRGVAHPMKAARQTRPALGAEVALRRHTRDDLIGECNRLRRVAVLESPRLARLTQRRRRPRTGWRRGHEVHWQNCWQRVSTSSSRAFPTEAMPICPAAQPSTIR
jgi:hypothetical protein